MYNNVCLLKSTYTFVAICSFKMKQLSTVNFYIMESHYCNKFYSLYSWILFNSARIIRYIYIVKSWKRNRMYLARPFTLRWSSLFQHMTSYVCSSPSAKQWSSVFECSSKCYLILFSHLKLVYQSSNYHNWCIEMSITFISVLFYIRVF